MFSVLKDHNGPKAIELVRRSQKVSLRKSAEERGYRINEVDETEGPTPRNVQIILNGTLDRKVYTEVKAGLEKIKFANLQYKLVEAPIGRNVSLASFSQYSTLFRCIHFAPPKYYTTYFTTTFRGLFYLGFHFEGNVSIKATSKINSAIDVVQKIMKNYYYYFFI